MNTKVLEFINKMKEEEKKQRDKNLISLGLVDETKKIIERQYLNYYSSVEKYDEEKKLCSQIGHGLPNLLKQSQPNQVPFFN